MAIVFTIAGKLYQGENVKLSIDDQYKNGQHIALAKVENMTAKTLQGTFVFELNKTGANTSSTRQSGDFVLKAYEEKMLSRSSVNLNARDSAHCKLVVKINDKRHEIEKVLKKD